MSVASSNRPKSEAEEGRYHKGFETGLNEQFKEALPIPPRVFMTLFSSTVTELCSYPEKAS